MDGYEDEAGRARLKAIAKQPLNALNWERVHFIAYECDFSFVRRQFVFQKFNNLTFTIERYIMAIGLLNHIFSVSSFGKVNVSILKKEVAQPW